MAECVVLDTDVASLLQGKRLPVDVSSRLVGKVLCVTFVTVGELFKGAYKRGWSSERMSRLEAWLRSVIVLPYDGEVARAGGRLMAQREAAGRPMPTNDAWIAACCLSRRLPLATLNRRHFEGIPGLELLLE